MKEKFKYPLSLLKIGKDNEAISILSKYAKYEMEPEAYRYLSEYFFKKNKFDSAIEYIYSAIKLAPQNYYYIFIAGLIYDEMGLLDKAINSYKSVIKLNSKFIEAYVNASVVHRKLKKYSEAMNNLENALDINPNLSIIYINRAQLYNEMDKYEEALLDFDKAIALEPKNPEFYLNKSNVLIKLERFQDALIECENSLFINNKFLPSLNNKVLILKTLKRGDEALDLVSSLILEYPNINELHFNKGEIESELGDYEKAIESYEKSIEINPKNELAYMKIGSLYNNIRKYDFALKYYDKALEVNPKYHDAKWNKCVTLLSTGRFSDAINYYDARWSISDIGRPKKIEINIPLWDLKSQCDKLLIYAEQGLGDVLLYIRYVQLIEKTVNEIWIKTDSRLESLIKRSFPALTVINDSHILNDEKFSHCLPIGDLLKLIQGHYKYNYVATKYLIANKTLTNKLYNILHKSSKLVCGITWHSNNSSKSIDKNIDIINLIESLKKINHIKFVSLQYHAKDEDLLNIKIKTGVDVLNFQEIDNFNDIDAHASLIEACDILILVCNTTAHIAGAIGKKAYLLRGRGRGVLWYWENHNFNTSSWYPSIEIFPSKISTLLTNKEYWDNAIEELVSRIGGNI